MSSELMHEVYALGRFRVDIKMPGLMPCKYRGFEAGVRSRAGFRPCSWTAANLGPSVLKGRRSTWRGAGEEVQSNDQVQEQVGAAGRSRGPGIRRCFLRFGGRVFDRQPDAGPSTVRGSRACGGGWWQGGGERAWAARGR